jgi:O-antigen/teichoic acid export membrane protein
VSPVDAFRRNTLWMLGGDLGARALQLVFGIVLARLLLPESFGLLVTVQILTGALGFVSAHGMGDALVRAPELGRRDPDTVLAVQLGVSLAIVAGLNLVAPAFASFFADPRLEGLLRLASLTFLVRPFMSVPSALLYRAARFREFSLLILLDTAVSGVASIGLALLGLAAPALILGGIAGALVRTALTARLAGWTPALAFDRGAAGRLGLYGLKLSANELVQYARVQTANALIGRRLGMSQVGLYNKADSVAEIPFEVFGGAAYHTLFRTLAGLRDSPDQGAELFLKTVAATGLYTLPLYVGLAFVAEPAIVLVYGEPWAEAALPLQILAAAGGLRALAYLSRSVAAAHDRLGRELIVQLETWAILMAGTAIGLQWGLPGVALGVLPSFVHNAVRMYGLAAGALGTGWSPLWQHLRPVLALNAGLALALAAAHLALTWAGLGGSRPLYLLLMVATGALAYAVPFLCYPPAGLREESLRWQGPIRGAARSISARLGLDRAGGETQGRSDRQGPTP